MAIFGYCIMKKMLFDIVDEVWDDGDALIVKNRKLQERIPLTNVMNVSYSPVIPSRVTLMLRHPGAFGKEVTFWPPMAFGWFCRSPIVDELIERIDAARRGQSGPATV